MYDDYEVEMMSGENRSNPMELTSVPSDLPAGDSSVFAEYDAITNEVADINENPAAAVFGMAGDRLPEGVSATDYEFTQGYTCGYTSRLIDIDGDGIYETTEITRVDMTGATAVLYRKDLDGDGFPEREDEFHFISTPTGVHVFDRVIRVDSDGSGSFDVVQRQMNDNAYSQVGFNSRYFVPRESMVRDEETGNWRTVIEAPTNKEQLDQKKADEARIIQALSDTGTAQADDEQEYEPSGSTDSKPEDTTDYKDRNEFIEDEEDDAETVSVTDLDDEDEDEDDTADVTDLDDEDEDEDDTADVTDLDDEDEDEDDTADVTDLDDEDEDEDDTADVTDLDDKDEDDDDTADVTDLDDKDEDKDDTADVEADDTNADDINAGFHIIEEREVDADGDGFADYGVYKFTQDNNNDGVEESYYWETYDTDKDGYIDAVLVLSDLDNDGRYESAETYVFDKNNDEFQLVQSIDISDPERGTLSCELDNFDPENTDASKVTGDPQDVLELWEYQGDTSRCAVYSQKFIIEEFTGVEVDIEDLVSYAAEQGWFSEEGGTSPENLNKLLDAYGIPNEMNFGYEISDIENALANGDRVIVAVDSGEYWMGESDDVYTPVDGADHAVEIIGIDRSDPEHPMVIANDSGNPNGKGEMIPLDVFVNAWADSNNLAVIAHRSN